MNIPVTFTESDGYSPTRFGEVVQLESAVLYTEQTLTPEQQAQARANIGITGTGAGVTPSVSFRYDETTGALYYEVSDAEVLDEAVF